MQIIVYKLVELLEKLKNLSIQPIFVEEINDEIVDDYDVLFMPADSNSLSLVKKIKEKKSKLNIIFVSDDVSSCFEAIKMHASGYILQDATEEDIQKELQNLRYGVYSRVLIRCFGEFDIFGDGVSISFKRKKCKELLAYLILHNGHTVPMKELAQVLFNDISSKKITYLYVLKREAIRALNAYGLKDVIRYQNNGFVADLKKVECDYIQYLEGKTSLYKGEFMNQYHWPDKIMKVQTEK